MKINNNTIEFKINEDEISLFNGENITINLVCADCKYPLNLITINKKIDKEIYNEPMFITDNEVIKKLEITYTLELSCNCKGEL
jgi:hypothetical protein